MESTTVWQVWTESTTVWQVNFLCGIALWIVISSICNVNQKLRSLTQPWVSDHVISGTHIILKIQKYHHRHLDALFSAVSCVVSVPFYTGFLPFLFWTGHCKLARQMTLLMAFCDYIGNCVKDVVSAPRPSSPPVRRITATKDEVDNAMEYGFPSSHTLNTVCLSGYLFLYMLAYNGSSNASAEIMGFTMACSIVILVGFARIYLGMHSLIDIIGGLALGLGILAFWLFVSEHIDNFIVSGQNVVLFWAGLSFLLLFAYPTPQLPTPSFDYHTAFTGVALGIVIGVHQTYKQFHHENVARIFSPRLTVSAMAGRVIVGIPTILVVKFCSKTLAKWILHILANTLGIPIRSTSYLPALSGTTADKNLWSVSLFSKQVPYDVDTGIRLLQYAGLAWSVVDLVPSLFSHLGL